MDRRTSEKERAERRGRQLSERIPKAIWVQSAGGGFSVLAVALLAAGWWILAVASGLLAAAAFAFVRPMVVRERIDEAVASAEAADDARSTDEPDDEVDR
jgi:hypothetical protein